MTDCAQQAQPGFDVAAAETDSAGSAPLSGDRPRHTAAMIACGHPDLPANLPLGVLDAAEQAITITKAGTRREIVYANTAFCTLTGYSLPELIGQSVGHVTGAQMDGPGYLRILDGIRRGRPTTAEMQCLRKDGSPYMLRTAVSPVRDDADQITHWISFKTDITGADTVHARLAQTAARFESTLAATGDAIWDWDIQADTLYLSASYLDLVGRPAAAPDGSISMLLDQLHAEDRPRFMRHMRAHLVEGLPFDITLRLCRADGHVIEATIRGGAIWDHDGTPRRMYGTVSDMGALMRSNQAHRRTEELASIGHWSVDTIGQTLLWSPEVYRIHGLDPDQTDVTLDLAINAYHPEDRDRVAAIVAAAEPFDFEARIVHSDGTLRHVHATGDVTRDAQGTVTQIFGTIQDCTRRVAESRREQTARKMEAYGQMAGGVAHDFNNLLAIIMGNLELLSESIPSSTATDDLIAEALAAVRRGRGLTGSLLSYSNKAVIRPRRIDANDALLAIYKSARQDESAPEVTLRVQCDPAAGAVRADPEGLAASLGHLIANARDAMPGGGRLTLASRHVTALSGDPLLFSSTSATPLSPGSYVVLSVRDEGHGIAPGDLDRVFEPFFTTRRVGRGSGLGLSQVLGFAQQSGGNVRIDSHPATGTTVSLILPCANGLVGGEGLEPPTSSV